MVIVDCKFKLAEDVLDTIIHVCDDTTYDATLDLVYSSVGKTKHYVRNAINFLSQFDIINTSSSSIKLSESTRRLIKEDKSQPSLIIKKAITEYPLFTEYCQTLNAGKSEKRVANIVIAKYKVDKSITTDKLISIFNYWLEYLQRSTEAPKTDISKIKVVEDNNSHFWIDEKGVLKYDEGADAKMLLQAIQKSGFANKNFINSERVDELKKLKHKELDLTKLIMLCQELNDAYRIGNYYTVGILVRAIIDHVPPLFGKRTFTEVANNYGSKSFRDTMQNIEGFAKKIADGFLHTTMRRKENIPNVNTVDCKNGMDILLGEIISILKAEP